MASRHWLLTAFAAATILAFPILAEADSGTGLTGPSPEMRQRMQERLQNMTPEQRQAFEQRRQKMRERLQNMTPEQKQKFRQRREALRRKLQSMTPEQRQQFREKLRNATPEQRRQMWRQFNSSDTDGSGIRWNPAARPANVAGRS